MRSARQSPEYASMLQCLRDSSLHVHLAEQCHASSPETLRSMYQVLAHACRDGAEHEACALIDAIATWRQRRCDDRLLPRELLPHERDVAEPRVWALCAAALFNRTQLVHWIWQHRTPDAAVLGQWADNMRRHPALCPHMQPETLALLDKLCGGGTSRRRGSRAALVPPPFRYCAHCNAYTCECAPPDG